MKTSAVWQALRGQGIDELDRKVLEDMGHSTASMKLHRLSEKIPSRKGVIQGDTMSP